MPVTTRSSQASSVALACAVLTRCWGLFEAIVTSWRSVRATSIGAVDAAPAVRIEDSVIKAIATLLDTAADAAVPAYLSTSLPLTTAIVAPRHHSAALEPEPLTTDVVNLVSTQIRWGGGALDRGMVGAPSSQALANIGA